MFENLGLFFLEMLQLDLCDSQGHIKGLHKLGMNSAYNYLTEREVYVPCVIDPGTVLETTGVPITGGLPIYKGPVHRLGLKMLIFNTY